MAAPLKVMVDAGHGGRDRGTHQPTVHEATITLAVAQHLEALLKSNPQFTVAMTRRTDLTVPLSLRSELAQTEGADVFLSIHVNSSPDPLARGAEFYFQNQLPPDEESMYLAHQEEMAGDAVGNQVKKDYPVLTRQNFTPEVKAILRDLLDGSRVRRSSDLTRALRMSWQGPQKIQSSGIRQAPFHVLSQVNIPSALVELGFLTNSRDFQTLTDSAAQRNMAVYLYNGLVAYKESLDKAP